MPVTKDQKAAASPMSFRMEALSGKVFTHTLSVRPEEVTYVEPSLQTPVMTLDGAFVDEFGRGLTTIQLSGHTGWGAGTVRDGHEEMIYLHAIFWEQWQNDRVRALQQGRDPSVARLIFVDTLNGYCSLVVPGQFVLKKSKSRPLLYQYQISMIRLGPASVPAAADPINVKNSAGGVLAGLASLAHTVNQVANAITQVKSFVDAATAYPLAGLMSLANGSMNSVLGMVGLDGVVSPQAAHMIGVAGDLVYASRNALQSISAVTSPSGYAAQQLSSAASACQDAYCVLGNTLRETETYPDYTGLYGASNCSSTVGGSPISAYANINPWTVIGPTVDSVAAITPAARAELSALKAVDPVLAPPTLSQLRAQMSTITQGVTLLA